MFHWEYNSAIDCFEVEAPMACDGDGANGQTGGIACYAPAGIKALDLLRNAGHPGNWWGILTDTGKKNGTPLIQDQTQPAPGAYISTTAYQFATYPNGATIPLRDVNRYLNAAAVKFTVVPERFQMGVPGIVLGCYCQVIKGSVTAEGIVGDIGPDFGEASIAMCKVFDGNASPLGDGIGKVLYRFFPGREVQGFPLIRRAK